MEFVFSELEHNDVIIVANRGVRDSLHDEEIKDAVLEFFKIDPTGDLANPDAIATVIVNLAMQKIKEFN